MFAGLLNYSTVHPPNAWVDVNVWHQTLYPFLTPDRIGHWIRSNALLVESQVFNTPWSHDLQQIPWQDQSLAVAFWGRLDNRTDLIRRLGLEEFSLGNLTDAQLVLRGWHRWGERLPEQLLGDFAFVVIDAEAKRLFLARDPLGVKPLYYWPHSQGFIFATTVSAFRCLKKLKLTPDPDWMARYMLQLSMSHDQTGYKEIFKLPPGHSLIVDSEGEQLMHQYHQWKDDAPSSSRRDQQWLDAYRNVLEESIRCRLASNYPLGTENSGGIDSATITAYVAKFLGDPGDQLHCFGFALCEQEPAYILETSQQCNIVHNYLITASSDSVTNFKKTINRTLQVLGYPEEHGMGIHHIPFYQECQRRGIRTLFSGYGGDEVVTNDGIHLRWELLDEQDYRALWDILPGNPLLRFLRLCKTLALSQRRPIYNLDLLRAWNLRWPYQILRQEVVERLNLHQEYMKLARYDAPYRRINDWIIDGLLKFPYVPTRLENCTLIASSYGIDYRWPLWDVRLVQQYLSTPSIEKVGSNGVGRFLHRRAINGTVPSKVAWKPTKYMGYSKLLQAKYDASIKGTAEQISDLEKNLHSDLVELIDLDKWRDQIQQAQNGKISPEFGYCFLKSAKDLQWLNHWLHMEDME